MHKISWCVDSGRKEDENLVIEGWAFCEENKVSISIEKCDNYNIESIERQDLFQKFNDNEALMAGFKITLPYINKCVLRLECNDEIVRHGINAKNLINGKKKNKIGSIVSMINVNNAMKVINNIKVYGVKQTFYKAKGKLRNTGIFRDTVNYDEWFKKNKVSEEVLKTQREYKFEFEPKISIVVPTYNTKKEFLVEMIESVRNQSYTNWELCIADGASTLEETITTLKEYEEDNRIKVSYLDKNLMISGNTNKALELVSGEYIGLFDHDDLLTEDALYEVVSVLNKCPNADFIYSDEDKVDETGSEYFDPHFKPDWSPDTLTSYNYITHFTVFAKALLEKSGNFNSEFDGSQDYDMFLRLTEKAENIVHIPKVLYHWRVHKNSTAGGIGQKKYAIDAAKKALNNHLDRVGFKGNVKDGLFAGSYKTEYNIIGNPKVSIIIPNKDQVDTLKKCINSILKRSTYTNYEIVIAENNSTEEKTFAYYDEIQKHNNIKVVTWKSGFNYSAINNFAVNESTGEMIILLNNDIEIISNKWIEEMLMHAQRKEVGIVGAKLYYEDDTIQHAGVILGIGGVAGHSHKYFHRAEDGHVGRLKVIQNLSAVTAACLMVRRDVYNEVEGLDEEFKVAFNDVDFCMKVRDKGYNVIFTPYAEMYHYESKSRGSEDTPEKIERFNGEIARFEKKWGLWIRDPYYNDNLTLEREDFGIKQ
ncbi:MAG: glycosyltransferase family 2 protein [Clostridium sp.]